MKIKFRNFPFDRKCLTQTIPSTLVYLFFLVPNERNLWALLYSDTHIDICGMLVSWWQLCASWWQLVFSSCGLDTWNQNSWVDFSPSVISKVHTLLRATAAPSLSYLKQSCHGVWEYVEGPAPMSGISWDSVICYCCWFFALEYMSNSWDGGVAGSIQAKWWGEGLVWAWNGNWKAQSVLLCAKKVKLC